MTNNKSIETKNKLLETSIRLFAQKEYNSVTIREIAEKSQLNSSLISYYFGSKQGLYEEIITMYKDYLISRLRQNRNLGNNPNNSLIKMFEQEEKLQDNDLHLIVIRALLNRNDIKSYNLIKDCFTAITNELKEHLSQCKFKEKYKNIITGNNDMLSIFIISMSKFWLFIKDVIIENGTFRNEEEIHDNVYKFLYAIFHELLNNEDNF